MALALTSSQLQVIVDANDGLFPHDTDEWAASQGDLQMLMGLDLIEMTNEGDVVLTSYGQTIASQAAMKNFNVVPVGDLVLVVFNA